MKNACTQCLVLAWLACTHAFDLIPRRWQRGEAKHVVVLRCFVLDFWNIVNASYLVLTDKVGRYQRFNTSRHAFIHLQYVCSRCTNFGRNDYTDSRRSVEKDLVINIIMHVANRPAKATAKCGFSVVSRLSCSFVYVIAKECAVFQCN